MSVMALDYGTKRIGVAVSDATLTLARALPALPSEPKKTLLQALQKTVQECGVKKILVGLPRNMNGSEGESALGARALAKVVNETFPEVEVKLVDERLSTVQASKLLHEAGYDSRKQKVKIDSASAQVVLQQYLDLHSTLNTQADSNPADW